MQLRKCHYKAAQPTRLVPSLCCDVCYGSRWRILPLDVPLYKLIASCEVHSADVRVVCCACGTPRADWW